MKTSFISCPMRLQYQWPNQFSNRTHKIQSLRHAPDLNTGNPKLWLHLSGSSILLSSLLSGVVIKRQALLIENKMLHKTLFYSTFPLLLQVRLAPVRTEAAGLIRLDLVFRATRDPRVYFYRHNRTNLE